MTGSMTISVVIPTRNRGEVVAKKVEWVLQQPNVGQIIVVIDGSTDDTALRLSRIRDPRLEVIHQSTSTGTPRAKNVGLSRVREPWVATLDDDDEHSDGYLAKLQQVAMAENVDLVCAPWLHVGPERSHVEAFGSAERSASGPVPGRPGLVPDRAFVETIWGPSNFLFRRRVLERGVRFDEGFRYNFWREETAFMIAAARAGLRVGSSNAAYSFVTGRAAGGIDRRSLGYELWTVLNDVRLMVRHGRWMVAHGYIDSPTMFVLGNAHRRASDRIGPLVRRLLSPVRSR